MAEEEGVTASWVFNKINNLESKLDSKINSLSHDLNSKMHSLEQNLRLLEDEMSRTAEAIEKMSLIVKRNLEEVLHKQEEANYSLDNSLKTSQAILAVNTAGFTDNAIATRQVNSSVNEVDQTVNKNTQAIIEIELLQKSSEAQHPMQFVRNYALEIDERFAKAIERIWLNRNLYDEHFNVLYAEYDKKMRTIGEHIFRIIEEDYSADMVEKLQIPMTAYLQLPEAVDNKRLEERSSQLDYSFEEFYAKDLKPILELHSKFETEMASKYSFEFSDEELNDFIIPTLISISTDGKIDIKIDSRIQSKKVDSEEYRNGFNILSSDSFSELEKALEMNTSAIVRQLVLHEITEDEIEKLMQSMEKLATKGIINPRLLTGYRQYLKRYGLKIDHIEKII